MSTVLYKPGETSAPPPGMPRKQNSINETRRFTNFAAAPPSRSNQHDGFYPRSHFQISDDELIAAAQSGDQQAFVELCSRYSFVVKKKILGIVRNQADAEDALQDTLLQAYTHLTSFRRSCKFLTWLTTIGVNSALMILRKRKIRKENNPNTGFPDPGMPELWEHVDQSPGPEGLYRKQQAILLVRREVQKLRPSLRSVVDHYYGAEYSLEESAKALDISLNAAKSRLLRGRARLRSSLARYGISNSGT